MQLKIAIMYILVVIFVFIFKHKKENVWLIAERGDEARDNGYSFFRYLKNYHLLRDYKLITPLIFSVGYSIILLY